ncbi:MAG: stage III sporulation protein AE [Clostridiales bacterium]|nr:stage III sporulation protein AE [Clostridiales bacterium]
MDPALNNPAALDKFYIDEQLKMFDFSGIDKASGLNFGEWVTKAITGELDLSPLGLVKRVGDMLVGELWQNWGLMRNLILISVLSAILKLLSDSFKNKQAGEMGFYVSFMAVVMVLLASFQTTLSIITTLVATASNVMTAALPIMFGVLLISGKLAGAAAFSPIFAVTIEGLSLCVRFLLLPVIQFGAMMEIVSCISAKSKLTNFTKLIRKVVGYALKGIALLFLTVLSLQKISSPIINSTALKVAKSGAAAIPVVGGMVSGAMDAVLFWGQAASSGLMVALVITLTVVCSASLIKILALLLMYKVTAALVQPVADDRIVKCIDAVGSFCVLLFEAGVVVVVMFIVSVAIMLAF